ncbi:S-adenosyl-L-methionine-dependent methyltransferase [Lojkania enalia]|uniref:S-adenosyl-L-methionine-dependent methyltransferase n=1 Tax=Lojkania enalia TaxID=147567 RepID=A0A9P4K3S5_9PLEO|nr:S-adenosyl-L-methionine-dependent methyltransferase [Didymosphaeria enalia]
MPCDQAEQDRLTILHQVFVHALEGKLTTTKITPMTRRILDLGTGPGHWAVAMAQQYPHTDVVGVDMAHKPPSTSEAGPSFNPYVLESEAQPGWHFSQPFDLIHLRNLAGSFAYWEDVYAEIYKNLAPGGCVEVADLELLPPEMTSSIALYLAGMQASYKSGRPLGTFYMHPTYLEDAGFKDVRTTSVNVPVGQWPEDEKQKKIGKMFLVTFMECLEAFSLRLLTKHGDQERLWTAEEVRETVEAGKKEILEWSEGFGGEGRREGWCANFKWIVGRKSKNA